MRLICTIHDVELGKAFSLFLNKQGIGNSCEVSGNGEGVVCRIWIYDEDQTAEAMEWFQRFQQNPRLSPPAPPPVKAEASLEKEPLGKVNFLILVICGLLSLFMYLAGPNNEVKKELLYDYPQTYTLVDQITAKPEEKQELLKHLNETPYWRGYYDQVLDHLANRYTPPAPMFEKIREGQVWRLFTPALMHADIFHLMFNMIWLIVIGKQMENKLGSARYLIFILLTGILSNTAQYLMSGPNFIGFSGILCAMIVFVWERQRKAPWEGYFLQPATWAFFAFYIALMAAVQIFSFVMLTTLDTTFSSNIANTAHLSGALIGYFLGRLNIFTAKL